MKKATNIHNIDSLEREIYRLKLEAKNIEEKLDHNLEHLKENYFSMAMNSFFQNIKHKGEEERSSFFDSFFKSEGFHAAANNITDHIANRTAESIETLVDKIFHKNK